MNFRQRRHRFRPPAGTGRALSARPRLGGVPFGGCRPWILVIFLQTLLWPALQARAEHFEISLTLEGSGDKTEAHADDSPPPEGLYPRPLFHGRKEDLLTLQFFMTDVNPHAPLNHVTVHYYIVPEQRAGQKELPSLDKNVVLQGRFMLDFKPKGKAGLQQHFRIASPGIYLVRVESENSGSDHEHFSAIDLEIK